MVQILGFKAKSKNEYSLVVVIRVAQMQIIMQDTISNM